MPLAGERATVQGRIERTDDARLLARYVARHPDAAAYARLSRLQPLSRTVERAHLVAGFGRIHWVDGGAVSLDATAVGSLPGRTSRRSSPT